MSKNQKIGVSRYIGLALGVIACLGLVLTLETGTARASIFPNDAFSAYTIAAGAGTACNDLLPAVSYKRTLLYGRATARATSSSGILIGSFNYLDIQTSLAADIDSFAPYVVPENTAVSCYRALNSSVIFRIAYVDYDLTAITASASQEPLLSSSSLPLKTYGFMTAGDILIALLLFGLIMLSLLTIFLRKI